MSSAVHVSSNEDGFWITDEKGSRPVAEDTLYRSSVLRDSLLAASGGEFSVTLPEAEMNAWLEAVSLLQLEASETNMDGLQCRQLACYIQVGAVLFMHLWWQQKLWGSHIAWSKLWGILGALHDQHVATATCMCSHYGDPHETLCECPILPHAAVRGAGM